MAVFMIVGANNPIYEAELGGIGRDDLAYLHQFILHSSLDQFEGIQWTNNATFLRAIDRFNNYVISAYMTPGGMRFLLLHDGHKEDNIRTFFAECHELYTKNMMNPFAQFNEPIVSRSFDNHVKSISKRVLAI